MVRSSDSAITTRATARRRAACTPAPANEPRCIACRQVDRASACDTCIRQAHELARDGHSAAEIAAVTQISEERASYLGQISEARDELERLKLDVVPTEGLRVLLAAARAQSESPERPAPPVITEGRIPDGVLRDLATVVRSRAPMSTSEIAEAAGYKSASTLARDLGVVAQPVRRAKDNQGPTYRDQIDVDSAGRIVRALGLAPCQVPWL